MIEFRARYDRLVALLTRRERRARLVRAAWMALLVPTGALAASAATGLRSGPWPWLAGVAVFAILAAVSVRRSAPDPGADLDRRFGLDELLVTAVEVDRRGPRGRVERRLLEDAAMAVAALGDVPDDDGVLRRELQMLLAVLLVLAGVWLLSGIARRPAPPAVLPPVGLGGDGHRSGPGTGAGSGGAAAGAGAEAGAGASPAMRGVSQALGDHAAARGVAAALASGDADAAARAARALADRSASMSPAGRRELADALHAAADATAGNADLEAALRRAARALEGPDPSPAPEAVEALADALARLEPARAAAGASAGTPRAEMREGPPAGRLAATAVPASLGTARPGGPPVEGAAAADGAPRAEATGRPRSAPTAALAVGETGGGRDGRSSGEPPASDALRYPWAMREALRRYFARGGER